MGKQTPLPGTVDDARRPGIAVISSGQPSIQSILSESFGLRVRRIPFAKDGLAELPCWRNGTRICQFMRGTNGAACRNIFAARAQALADDNRAHAFSCFQWLTYAACRAGGNGDDGVVFQTSLFRGPGWDAFLRRLAQTDSSKADEIKSLTSDLPLLSQRRLLALGELLHWWSLWFLAIPSLAEEKSRTEAKTVALDVLSLLATDDLYPVTLETLAAKAGISPSRLSHAVHDSTGMPFRHLLNRARLSLARRLLASTPLSIKEVAHRCGYSSDSAFICMFKNATGQTPCQFRQSIREK
jgi:AraC-like DNA-binding protein